MRGKISGFARLKRTNVLGGQTSNTDRLGYDVVETVEAVEKAQWNEIVERSTRGSVFHRYEWLDALENGLGYEPAHLVVTKDGNTIGVFPNFVIDLPKVPFKQLSSLDPGFGGPLLPTDRKKSLSLVLNAVPTLCTGRTVVHQLRTRDLSYLKYNNALQSRGYRPHLREGRFLLDLTDDYDDIRSDMSKGRRKGITRGRDHDHEIVEEAVTRANLERFHHVYEQHMNEVGGEVYPMAFFEKLTDMKSRVLLLTIRIDGEYAGGFLELLDDEQSVIHGFLAAVPDEYLDDHASELLYDYVFRWGIEHGYETYDFGGSETHFENGVLRYKAGFGGQFVPTLIWERGCSPLWKPLKLGRSFYLQTYA